MLSQCIETLKLPPKERTQERIHRLVVLLTDDLCALSRRTPYNQLCVACRGAQYAHAPANAQMEDADEGQNVFRVVLSGSLRVQRKLGKAWVPMGFVRAGDVLGLAAMLQSVPDSVRYATAGEGASFVVIRRFDFERCLRATYERQVADNVALLQRTPSFGSLPEATVKQLVFSSRLVTVPAGELLAREGDTTDELFVLKSGAVRLVKSLLTREVSRWPTTNAVASRLASSHDENGATAAAARDEEGRGALAARASVPVAHDRRSGGTGPAATGRGGLHGCLSPVAHVREGVVTHCKRIVVVGDVSEGSAFAYDEAIRVIQRLALARSAKLAAAPSELPPIRRNMSAYSMSPVQAIALSPVALLLLIACDGLAAFVHSFGSARTPAVLGRQLHTQRDWAQYKQRLLADAASRPPTPLQQLIGPRRYGDDPAASVMLPGMSPNGGPSKQRRPSTARSAHRRRSPSGADSSVRALDVAMLRLAGAAQAIAVGDTIIETFNARSFHE